jgi:lipopolysaccharide transport system permease protein/teichoic acid transport system permease protein
MVRREVKTQYIGSFLGVLWTFIHPLALICVFWVVFSVGFKVQPVNDVPFVVWLTAGMAIWFVFAESVSGSVGAITGNANLIQKTVFPSQILPLIKIISSLVTHSVFLLVLLGFILFQHMPFSIWFVQAFYYLFCMVVLALGLGWGLSALNVFIRDTGQVVAVLLQIGFWATPIFWDINIMPPEWQKWIKLNPVFYLVQGYRDTFIYFTPFWHYPWMTLYFWSVTLLIFVTGALLFQKLKPHFADVL